MYATAIGALVSVIGFLLKVIHVLYKKNEAKGDALQAFAEKMLKGEFCVTCKKNL